MTKDRDSKNLGYFHMRFFGGRFQDETLYLRIYLCECILQRFFRTSISCRCVWVYQARQMMLLLLLPQCNVCFLFISGLQLACTQLLAPFSISQIFLKYFSQATESSSNVCFVSKWFGAGLGLYPFIFTICFYFNPMYWWLCIRCASQKYVSTFIRPNI